MNVNVLLKITMIFTCTCSMSCENLYNDSSLQNKIVEAGDSTRLIEPVIKSFALDDFYSPSHDLDSIVQVIYDGLTLKEKAAQLIMDATSEVETANLPFSRAEKLIRDTVIGGLLFLKGKKASIESQIKKLDSVFIQHRGSRLLYSCDCEPALFHRKILNTEKMKTSIDLKDANEVEQAAGKIASIIKVMGIQINFAPVTDIALNKKAINNRSFGNNSIDIITKSNAFVSSTQFQQIVSCVKHFPGHGAVEGDTHKGQVIIDGALSELKTFASVIHQSNPVMVMVGHMTVKNNTRYNTGGLPCSVSSQIITKLLKTELEFKGIVITDAMRMSALDRTPDADFKAIQAGADIVLIPRDPKLLNRKIREGFTGDNLLRDQLEASVKKILRLKVCMGRVI